MTLFAIQNRLKRIKEKPFRLERDLQSMIEQNLEEVFGLLFIASEFAPSNTLRIDTVAFDTEQKSFVLIEYKRGTHEPLIDQGFAYLSMLINNRAEFILKAHEVLPKLKRDEVNWEASRVIFVAASFTPHQREALGIQDLPFEFWEAKLYEASLLSLDRLQSQQKGVKLAQIVPMSESVRKVTREVKTYTVDDHFGEGWEETRELYDALLAELTKIDPRLQVEPRKGYIALKIGAKNALSFHTYQSKLRFQFPRNKASAFAQIDPHKRVKDILNSMKYYNQYISYIDLNSQDDIPYALTLARRVLKMY